MLRRKIKTQFDGVNNNKNKNRSKKENGKMKNTKTECARE
jgi:hypothetical protein